MRTLILCGGKGTRAYPHTLELPKPLLEVGDRPVLVHLMEIYAAQGFTDFVLAGGYKLPLLESFARELPGAWTVEVVDTGEDTNTGGRVARCAELVGDTFFVTYADGLGNVDLAALADFHRGHEGSATITTVPLPSQYGTIDIDGAGRVVDFKEKPRLPDHLINAGFFVFDQAAFEHWAGEDLERDVLPALGSAGALFAYCHEGFWKSMDTYTDALDLASLCSDGRGPWLAEPGRHLNTLR
ncbi:glucose-1-phosphate cytidylyltransferase [soil metagenome]